MNASPPVKPLANRRTTIGLLSTGMWHSLSVELWRGVQSAAQSKGVNLVFYAGDEIRAHHEAYTDMPNVLYDLVDPGVVDGLIIWTSAIGSVVSNEELRVFCDRFKPLPILCVGRKVEGLPLLAVDSLSGVRQVLEHLIRDHGFGRIAFIRGPEDNIDAEQRYATYLDVLAKNNLAVDPGLITPPAPWRTANENILVLVRDRHLRPGADFQAVMGVGDVVAARAVRTLQECGFGVPQDVAVVGFDGEEAAKEASPLHITTSPLMLFEQGYRAVEILLAQIGGAQIPAEEILPAKLLIRQTCGCPSPVVAKVGSSRGIQPSASGLPANSWPDRLAACRVEAVKEISDILGFESADLPKNWAEQLWNAFLSDLRHKQGSIFLSRLGAFQDRTMMSGSDRWGTWQNFLSAFRRRVCPSLAGDEVMLRAEDLLHQARITLAEAETRWQVFVQLHRRYQDYLLREAGQRFITLFDIETLIEALVVELPRLHIVGTYISMYEDPGRPTGNARLILALGEQGRKLLPEKGRLYPARRLVPEDLLPLDRPYALVVSPLYFRDSHIGLAAFEASPGADEMVYDALPRLISSPLKSAMLVQALLEKDKELERLADIDILTGISNRRHFFELGEREITRALRYKRPAAAIMIDIDHFKDVNDTHGHGIGDEVLRILAERLHGVLRQTDILGRYGGEEFAVLLSETEPEMAKLVADRLCKSINREPLAAGGQSIPLTISIGVSSLGGDLQDLAGLLARADAAMYAAKHSGRNRVVFL